MAKHLHLDPFSGVAGDMFLGALVDLGLDLDGVRAALNQLPVDLPYQITTDRVYRHGIGAVDLKVRVSQEGAKDTADAAGHTHSHHHHHGDDAHPHGHHHHHHHDHHHGDVEGHAHHHEHRHDHESDADPHHSEGHGHAHAQGHPHEHGHPHHHHHTGYRELMAMVERLDTTPRGRRRAGAVVRALAEAEARVHGKTLEQIHFHEVGAVDSIVDMLGSVVGLELLEIDSLSCGVLPISSGFVRCDHGMMPVPAPATAYLLEGLPTAGVARRGELITPTGAALVRALCDRFGPPPAMTFRGVGYGAGDREDPQIPNLLRVFCGDLADEPATAAQPTEETLPPGADHETPKSGKDQETATHAHRHDHDHPPTPGHAHPHGPSASAAKRSRAVVDGDKPSPSADTRPTGD